MDAPSFYACLSLIMIPDFLVIGAQKSGTTWLDRNLRNHPNIWLPPEKEIHFFDFPPLIPFFFLLFAPMRPVRHWAKNRMLRDWKKVCDGEQACAWYIRYYFGVRTQGWYVSLFKPAAQQCCGEVTPRYAILSEAKIAKVHALMPDAKIIYLLRNPIERIWSDLAMFSRPKFGSQGLQADDDAAIQRFISNASHQASSRYVRNLERWGTFYPPEQMFIGFQGQIRDNPEQLLKDVCQFLAVDASDEHISKMAKQRINSHDYPDMPPGIAKALAKLFISDIEMLHQRFDNEYTAQWLASAQGYLDEGKG
ncbi:MAG: sulfotransferase [Methylovulum sp.]|nr:sulfotransferase [Methylovulum sp.]